MAGLIWDKATGTAEWDEFAETPTEMCDRLIEENGIGARRGQSIASGVRSVVFQMMRREGMPLSAARAELLEIVKADLEFDGFSRKMSADEKNVAEYMFERMIADGWHTLDESGKSRPYVEPSASEYLENQHQDEAPVLDNDRPMAFPLAAILWAFMVMGRTAVLVTVFVWFQIYMGGKPKTGFDGQWMLIMSLVAAVVVQWVFSAMFKRKESAK